MPDCIHNKKKIYSCNELTYEVVTKFREAFYATCKKSDQDSFIMKHTVLVPRSGRQKRTAGSRQEKQFTGRFFVRKFEEGKDIQVCERAFRRILGVGNSRIQNILRTYATTGNVVQDKRGGDHISHKFNEKKEGIMKYIISLRCLESHYCRSNTRRSYLSSDLNIEKLASMYNAQAKENLKVKNSYFRYVFNHNFNLGFGSPRVDVCSTCLELTEKIKHETDPRKLSSLQTTQAIHKKRAKAFFSLLREKHSEILTLSFDCQKNLANPKIPDQEAYYRRQLYLFNFSIVVGSSQCKMSRENCFSYVWTEGTYPKGSNEVASCVFHCLQNLDLSGIKKIRLFADGCGGQNKNKTMIAMLQRWLLQSPKNVEEVELIFPIRGHSFIPPDRLFGLCEKEFKKQEVIENPQGYINIIEKYATIRRPGIDLPIFDWKQEATDHLKPIPQWHFKFKPSKRYHFKRSTNSRQMILVQGEEFYYHSCGNFKSLMKGKKNVLVINPSVIVKDNTPVNNKKVSDVKRLLALHFGSDWQSNPSLKFYVDFFTSCEGRCTADPEFPDVMEDMCGPTEEAPELCV